MLFDETEGAALDFDWIRPRLAVGGHIPPRHVPALAREHGVRRVVDLRQEDCDDAQLLGRHGIQLLHLPTQDCCAISQASLDRGVAWATAQLAAGERVLIHCQHGIGRSALLALCVMVAEGAQPLDALEGAKEARPRVSPSPEQLEAFRSWAGRHRDAGRPALVVPTLEALFQIAYRHLQLGEVGTGTAGPEP
jgi:hypothetical protein